MYFMFIVPFQVNFLLNQKTNAHTYQESLRGYGCLSSVNIISQGNQISGEYRTKRRRVCFRHYLFDCSGFVFA